MKYILLSGGSGKRLWPVSSSSKAKQFIQIFQNENKEPESMLQRSYRLLSSIVSKKDILISSSEKQKEYIYEQLGKDVNLVLEPSQRDTFPAIVLSILYLLSKGEIDEDSLITVLPVDSLVDLAFYKFLVENQTILSHRNFNILLTGVKPTYPSQKYGYILREGQKEISDVISFREKPSEAKAKELIASKALWNTGVFCLRAKYILDICLDKFGHLDYSEFYKNYSLCEKISFDYAVLEKADHVGVRAFSGVWKDIGTWNTFVEEMSQPIIGNVISDPSCPNVNGINQLNIPIIVSGIDDLIFVATEDGILIASHNGSSYIKPLVEKLDAKL